MGKTLADLQSNISISADNAVTGDIEWCSGYTEFSDDIGELAGWYLALKVSPSAEGSALEGATITATYAGTVRTLEDGETFIIRLAEGEDSITFTANKEGYTEGRLTLDLSGLEKEELENTCYVSSETTGITVDPLQFGDSKDLSGTVPFDTTTDSNHFSLKYRTFNRVPAESEIYVSFDGTQLGSSTFYTVVPLDGESYSEAIVDITITSEIIGSLVPVLTTLISPAGSDLTDSFYCSLDVSELTLAPDPTPRMNITSADSKTTIIPSTFNVAKAATGQAPYNTTNSYNYLALNLAYSGTWDLNYYKIVVYDDSAILIWDSPVYAGSTNLPMVVGINPITSSNVGTGKYIDITIYSGETALTLSTAVNTIRIDTSALTLEPAPSPEVNITSNYPPVSITPTTYSTTKTATGTLQWDPTYNSIASLSIQLQGNAYVSSTRYTITAYIENDSTLVVGQVTNRRLTSAFNMECNIATYVGTASYITIAFSPNDLPPITIDITGLTTFDGKITPSGITYQGQTYSASDFISGGTVTRSYNNTVIDGATIKYTTVNGVSGYYLAFTVPDTRYTVTSAPIRVWGIPTTADYEALVADSSGFPSVNLIHFLGNAPADITINILYPSGTGQSTLPIELRFTNCTFEAPPAPSNSMNISSNSSRVTISPSQVSSTKTATGAILYNHDDDNYILKILVEIPNVEDFPALRDEEEYGFIVTYLDTTLVDERGSNIEEMEDERIIPIDSSMISSGSVVLKLVAEEDDGEGDFRITRTFYTITLNISGITLQSPPTVNLNGEDSGSGTSLFDITTNYTDYYNLNSDDICTCEINYRDTSEYDDYYFLAYDGSDGDNGNGVLLIGSPNTWHSILNLNTTNLAETVFMTRDTLGFIGATSAPLTPTSGEFIEGVILDLTYTPPTGTLYNGFILVDITTPITGTIYHYVKSGNNYIDIASKKYLCFLAMALSSSDIHNPIEMKLYNSNGTDYVRIVIYTNNITVTTI